MGRVGWQEDNMQGCVCVVLRSWSSVRICRWVQGGLTGLGFRGGMLCEGFSGRLLGRLRILALTTQITLVRVDFRPDFTIKAQSEFWRSGLGSGQCESSGVGARVAGCPHRWSLRCR